MTEQKTRHPGIYRMNDGRYRILATRRDPSGARLRAERTLPHGTTLEDARKARVELQRELEEGPKTDKTEETSLPTTVASFSNRWLAVRSARLKESVKARYLHVLATQILPRLGELPLREVTRSVVESWVAEVEGLRTGDDRPYSTATLISWYRVLSTILKDAAAEYGLPDPTLRIRPPKTSVAAVREVRTLTKDDLSRLLSVAETSVPGWRAEIATLVVTGMRPGELYALSWGDIDFEGRSILIRRAVWKGVIAGTKTGSPRVAPLVDVLATILKAHRTELDGRGVGVGPDDLVFPSKEGTPRATSSLAKTLRFVREMAGITQRLSPQVLRRTLNTLLVESGVSGIVLRSILGHTTEAMTVRYSGVHVSAKLAAVEGLLADGVVRVDPNQDEPKGLKSNQEQP